MPPADHRVPSPPGTPGDVDPSDALARLNERRGGALPQEARRVAKVLERLRPAACQAIIEQRAQAAAGLPPLAFASMLRALADD